MFKIILYCFVLPWMYLRFGQDVKDGGWKLKIPCSIRKMNLVSRCIAPFISSCHVPFSLGFARSTPLSRVHSRFAPRNYESHIVIASFLLVSSPCLAETHIVVPSRWSVLSILVASNSPHFRLDLPHPASLFLLHLFSKRIASLPFIMSHHASPHLSDTHCVSSYSISPCFHNPPLIHFRKSEYSSSILLFLCPTKKAVIRDFYLKLSIYI